MPDGQTPDELTTGADVPGSAPRLSRRRRMIWWIAGATVVAGLIGLRVTRQSDSDSSSDEYERTIQVLLTLQAPEQPANGTWDDCWGVSEFGDFGPGELVLAFDDAGVRVGDGTTERLADFVDEDGRAWFDIPGRGLAGRDDLQAMASLFPWECSVLAWVHVNRDLPAYELVFGSGSLKVLTADLIKDGHKVAMVIPQRA